MAKKEAAKLNIPGAITPMSIQQTIINGKTKLISVGKLNYKKVLAANDERLVINFESIFTRYRWHLNKHVVTVELSDEEYLKYRFRPKSLSMYLYGTIELAPLLLDVNNVLSIAEFDFKRLKVYDGGLIKFITEILNKEEASIRDNTVSIHNETV